MARHGNAVLPCSKLPRNNNAGDYVKLPPFLGLTGLSSGRAVAVGHGGREGGGEVGRARARRVVGAQTRLDRSARGEFEVGAGCRA